MLIRCHVSVQSRAGNGYDIPAEELKDLQPFKPYNDDEDDVLALKMEMLRNRHRADKAVAAASAESTGAAVVAAGSVLLSSREDAKAVNVLGRRLDGGGGGASAFRAVGSGRKLGASGGTIGGGAAAATAAPANAEGVRGTGGGVDGKEEDGDAGQKSSMGTEQDGFGSIGTTRGGCVVSARIVSVSYGVLCLGIDRTDSGEHPAEIVSCRDDSVLSEKPSMYVPTSQGCDPVQSNECSDAVVGRWTIHRLAVCL